MPRGFAFEAAARKEAQSSPRADTRGEDELTISDGR